MSGDIAEQVIAGVKDSSSGLPFKSMSGQMSPSVANGSFMSTSRHSKSKTEGILSHRFLANHWFHLSDVGRKCCSSTTGFPFYMGM